MIHIIEFIPDYKMTGTMPIEKESAINKFYQWQAENKDIDVVTIQKDGTSLMVAYKKKIEKREVEKAIKNR